MFIKDYIPTGGSVGGTDVGVTDKFGDIEEALAELFDADSLLSGTEPPGPPEIELVGRKIKQALHLLDRPWH